MAETHFFMTQDDCLDLVAFLMELTGAEFVPERSDSPPPFPRYTTLAEMQTRMEADPHYSRFFVLSSRWERFPLEFDEIHANDGQHFFSGSQRYGGPASDLILSRTWTEGDSRWIVAGSFGDYPYYVESKAFLTDMSQYRTIPRPGEMVAVHKAVRNYLAKSGRRSVCRETGHAGPWIGPGALREFESGTWLRGGDWHFEPAPRKRKAGRVKR